MAIFKFELHFRWDTFLPHERANEQMSELTRQNIWQWTDYFFKVQTLKLAEEVEKWFDSKVLLQAIKMTCLFQGDFLTSEAVWNFKDLVFL
jgi:hypothetical protein